MSMNQGNVSPISPIDLTINPLTHLPIFSSAPRVSPRATSTLPPSMYPPEPWPGNVTLSPMSGADFARWCKWELILAREHLLLCDGEAEDPVTSLAAIYVALEMMAGWALGNIHWLRDEGLDYEDGLNIAAQVVDAQSRVNGLQQFVERETREELNAYLWLQNLKAMSITEIETEEEVAE